MRFFFIEKNFQIKKNFSFYLEEKKDNHKSKFYNDLIGYRGLCAPSELILKYKHYDSQITFNCDCLVKNFPLLGGLLSHWKLRPTMTLPSSKNNLLTFVPTPCRGGKFKEFISIENVSLILDRDESFVGIEHIRFNSNLTLWKDGRFIFALKTRLNVQDPLDCYEDPSEFTISNLNLGAEYKFNSTTLMSIRSQKNMRNIVFSLWKSLLNSVEICSELEIPFLYEDLCLSLGSRIILSTNLCFQGVLKKKFRQHWNFLSRLDIKLRRWLTCSISLNSKSTLNGNYKIQVPSVRLEVEF